MKPSKGWLTEQPKASEVRHFNRQHEAADPRERTVYLSASDQRLAAEQNIALGWADDEGGAR